MLPACMYVCTVTTEHVHTYIHTEYRVCTGPVRSVYMVHMYMHSNCSAVVMGYGLV